MASQAEDREFKSRLTLELLKLVLEINFENIVRCWELRPKASYSIDVPSGGMYIDCDDEKGNIYRRIILIGENRRRK